MMGDEVDVTIFPAPKWHEKDGGRYIGTGTYSITRDPEENWLNAGAYRAQVHDKKTVQGKVLGAILAKVHGLGDGVGGLDAATRYYVIARFSYGYADADFDDANNLARSAGIESNSRMTRRCSPMAPSTSATAPPRTR